MKMKYTSRWWGGHEGNHNSKDFYPYDSISLQYPQKKKKKVYNILP